MILTPLLPVAFLAYLHNDIYPPLLTAAEEAAALEQMALGQTASADETMLRAACDARNLLIERNLRLVAHICKKFESSGVEKDDLISIGTIGLIKGVATFSPAKGARLATYAARCIENEVLMYLRSIRNQRTEISLYDPVGADKEGNEVTLIDILDSPDLSVAEIVELAEEKQLLADKLNILDEKDRFVLHLRYGLGGGAVDRRRMPQKEVARRLGISRSYISRIEKRAIQKLRSAMENG